MLDKLRVYNLIICLSAVSLISGCVSIYNPATRRQEILLINTKNEVSLGQNMDTQLKRQLKISKDSLQIYRLDSIGAKVAAVSDRQDVVYHFRVVEDKELNAFALPGGYIYVNSGLMQRASDDELAGVLAHEVGHIASRHTVKKLQAVLGYQVLMNIILGINTKQYTVQAIDVVFNLASLGYGRKDEFFADKLAVKYTRLAGFSPYGMLTLLEKLKKEAESKGANLRIVFLSSHPPLGERIKRIEEEIRAN